jgi:hypothetical protein
VAQFVKQIVPVCSVDVAGSTLLESKLLAWFCGNLASSWPWSQSDGQRQDYGMSAKTCDEIKKASATCVRGPSQGGVRSTAT